MHWKTFWASPSPPDLQNCFSQQQYLVDLSKKRDQAVRTG